MKRTGQLIWAISLVALAIAGCSGEAEMTKKDEQEFKDGFKKGLQTDKMTPEQKKKMEEFMQGRGGAQSAPGSN